jgi:hypothetical protein
LPACGTSVQEYRRRSQLLDRAVNACGEKSLAHANAQFPALGGCRDNAAGDPAIEPIPGAAAVRIQATALTQHERKFRATYADGRRVGVDTVILALDVADQTSNGAQAAFQQPVKRSFLSVGAAAKVIFLYSEFTFFPQGHGAVVGEAQLEIAGLSSAQGVFVLDHHARHEGQCLTGANGDCIAREQYLAGNLGAGRHAGTCENRKYQSKQQPFICHVSYVHACFSLPGRH